MTHCSLIEETASLIRRYDRPGPRYTSYPTAVEFNEHFDAAAYCGRLQAAAAARDEPLSLYVHLPFCEARCTYCGCMMIATRSDSVIARYLEHLEREIEMLARHLGGRRRVVQHHWGGGTPTSLSPEQIARLDAVIASHFDQAATGEKAIEIDPRVTTREQIQLLRSLGFNRLSMGVQDFAGDVQEAIGRRQSEAATRRLYEYARGVGFTSINLDLVYGLPRQTLDGFNRTLASIVDLAPDRVAVYSYAHMPWIRPHQNRIPIADLPDAAAKFALIGAAVDVFGRAGYVAIGMDHFAQPGDELARASSERRLHRNFMGYTTCPASDMVGLGVSAIGDVRGAFAQNHKKLSAYYQALEAGRFPTARGYALSHDDIVRRHVITELMCNFHVDCTTVARRFGIDFAAYFAGELERLRAPDGPVGHGLAVVTPGTIEVTARGRLFVRTICMTFDRYLAGHAGRPVFSRTV